MAAKANAGPLLRQLRRIEPTTRTATRRALNKVGAQANTLTLRLLAGAIGVTQTKMRQYVRLVRADFANLAASVRITPHTFNVASFNSRQTKRGVSSSAWGKRRVYRSTFLIQGGRTAMRRVGKARLPIRPVYGPRIHREFAREQVEAALNALVAAKLPGIMRHELAFALGKIGVRRT